MLFNYNIRPTPTLTPTPSPRQPNRPTTAYRSLWKKGAAVAPLDPLGASQSNIRF